MKIKIDPLCPICGELSSKVTCKSIELNRYLKTCGKKECSNKLRNMSNLIKYGVENVMQLEEIKDKSKQTCLDRYGVENVMQLEEFKDKIKETCLDRYGVEYVFQNKEIKDKSKITNLNKYGVENAMQSKEIQAKGKQTSINKYGVDSYSKTPEYKEKVKETMLEKYGVKYPMQNSDIFEKSQKSGHSGKYYILPSGKETFVQGYENQYLNEYFQSGGLEENILISVKEINSRLGKINYISIEDNKIHRYYPDFYLIKENKIVEVKSTWTYNRELEKNLSKQKACISKGFNFEFKFYDKTC